MTGFRCSVSFLYAVIRKESYMWKYDYVGTSNKIPSRKLSSGPSKSSKPNSLECFRRCAYSEFMGKDEGTTLENLPQCCHHILWKYRGPLTLPTEVVGTMC
jgi:hypothetical protein